MVPKPLGVYTIRTSDARGRDEVLVMPAFDEVIQVRDPGLVGHSGTVYIFYDSAHDGGRDGIRSSFEIGSYTECSRCKD